MKRFGSAVLLLALVGAMAAVPASAGTLYDNTTASSYTLAGYYDQSGYTYYSITDSFTLSSAATITGATFASWTDPGATVSGMQWAIGNSAFGTNLASGWQSNPYTGYIGSYYGYWDIDSNAVSIGSLLLGAGTYWLTLSNGTATDYGTVAWDESNGPSSAIDLGYGDIFSETFTIQGNTGVTPEPSSLLFLGSGLAALAGMLRRKVRV
jgi:hypothetical protein